MSDSTYVQIRIRIHKRFESTQQEKYISDFVFAEMEQDAKRTEIGSTNIFYLRFHSLIFAMHNNITQPNKYNDTLAPCVCAYTNPKLYMYMYIYSHIFLLFTLSFSIFLWLSLRSCKNKTVKVKEVYEPNKNIILMFAKSSNNKTSTNQKFVCITFF